MAATVIRRQTATIALATLAIAIGAVAGDAQAAAQSMGKSGAWEIFVDDQGGKTCYAVSKPTAQSPTTLKWDPVVYVLRGAVTNGRDEPSVRSGYTYEDGSNASISIGGDTFTLFTDKDGAWVADPAVERNLVEKMKAGSSMIVKGTSSRGNVTTDTYSLSGITAAVDKINDLCP